MPDGADYKDLARKYGFAPKPESVLRLTQLVARQDSDVDEIARLISEDPGLRARLLRVANPDAENEAEYTVDTVESALMRNGIGCALLLAMGTPLALALTQTFQTMLSQKLDHVDRNSVPLPEGEHLLGTISFVGRAVGHVYLRLSIASARQIASTILGLDPKELGDGLEINDAIGEVLNIMTGNFKSNLCDAGLDCRLRTPEVRRTTDRFTPIVPGGGLERMAFSSGKISLFVDVTVNPWNEE
jgi:CheY-specific phosphatase CheX